ncbi:hypothetical protein [Flavobacterium sp.]|jgi:hypothetical protein|uniref:hypothetical protein n=1 Tax=Flavobacterium sp. TaxID=239 RepID=UPI0037C150FC
MKNIFKKYRVKEINGKFIPQRRDFPFWEGIDKELNFLWFGSEYQEKYCLFDNLEDAKTHLFKYKEKEKEKIKYYY